jgi:transposase-like protein
VIFKKKCPRCRSSDIRLRQVYHVKNNGKRSLFICRSCKNSFSETFGTPAAGLKTTLSRVAQVISARSEGTGFNACCRIFKIGKDTLSRWETRFASLKKTLFLYSLCHSFLSQVVEGDELYTKVGENKPACDSEGWTIVLMERASRFIWHMECGRPDERLFQSAIDTLCKIIDRSGSTTLITDGERRYGNLLFEVCSELLRTGNPGRPKKHSNPVLELQSRTRDHKNENAAVKNANISDHGQSTPILCYL